MISKRDCARVLIRFVAVALAVFVCAGAAAWLARLIGG